MVISGSEITLQYLWKNSGLAKQRKGTRKKKTNKKNKQTHTQNPVKLKINYLLKNVVVKIWDSNITYLSKVAQTLRTQFSCENESFEKLTAGMKYTPFLDKKAKSNTQK